MYTIQKIEELDALLQEQCEHACEAVYSEDADKLIIPVKDGKWFDKDIFTPLWIYKGSCGWKIESKLEQEDIPKIKRTIIYIWENFDRIYQSMLETLLPFLIDWEMEDRKTGKKVVTTEQLHDARDITIENDREVGCIEMIQLNCQFEKDGMVAYSFKFMPDIFKYGYDDGFEVVFFQDKVVYFTDGNMCEVIFDFPEYKDSDTYFGI